MHEGLGNGREAGQQNDELRFRFMNGLSKEQQL